VYIGIPLPCQQECILFLRLLSATAMQIQAEGFQVLGFRHGRMHRMVNILPTAPHYLRPEAYGSRS
jgi:hypothetical protein